MSSYNTSKKYKLRKDDMSKINKMERKFGRFAIRNLSLYVVICFAISYVLEICAEDVYLKLVFSPYHIFSEHEYWRIFTWIFTTPGNFTIFTLIMMFVYYSFGRAIERGIGTFMYNIFIFSSLLFTTIGATVVGALQYFGNENEIELIGSFVSQNDAFREPGKLLDGTADVATKFVFETYINGANMTYYLMMGLFLGFALIHSDAIVLLYFIIPFKVSWLAFFDIFMMGIEFISTDNLYLRVNIVSYLLAFGMMYLIVRKYSPGNRYAYARGRSSQMKRKSNTRSKEEVEMGQVIQMPNSITRHKCAICGRSEKDDFELEFRFCSKCNGNYEYCKEHLYNHEHIK